MLSTESAAFYRKHGVLGLSSAHSSEKNWNSGIEGFQELLGELVGWTFLSVCISDYHQKSSVILLIYMTAFPSHMVTWSQHRYVQLYYCYHSFLPPWHRPIIICPSVFLPIVTAHPSVTFILITSFMRTIHTRVLWNIDHQKRWALIICLALEDLEYNM